MEEAPTKKNHVWIKLAVLLFLLGGLPLLFLDSDVCRFFLDEERIIDFLDSLGPWGFVGFIALQAAQVVLAPIPGDVTGFLGGYLYGSILGTILSTIGLTIGSYVAFVLSKTFGKPFANRFIPRALLDRFDYLLHHKGAFIVFLLFLIPSFPKDYLCYIPRAGESFHSGIPCHRRDGAPLRNPAHLDGGELRETSPIHAIQRCGARRGGGPPGHIRQPEKARRVLPAPAPPGT